MVKFVVIFKLGIKIVFPVQFYVLIRKSESLSVGMLDRLSGNEWFVSTHNFHGQWRESGGTSNSSVKIP